MILQKLRDDQSTDGESETYFETQHGEGQWRLVRQGGSSGYALLESENEVAEVRNRFITFRQQFTDYREYREQVEDLWHRYEELEQIRSSIRQSIHDTNAIVIFSEECDLVGLAT